MNARLFAAALVAASLAAVAAPARSAVLLDNFSQGSFTSSGAFQPVELETSPLVRSFFAFNLNGVPAISGAEVTFAGGNGRLVTESGSVTLALWAFGGNVDDLVSGAGGTTVFNQLGSGTQIGSATLGPIFSDPMPEFTVTLSADFVTQLNALRISSDPRIAFGVSIGADFGIAWLGGSAFPAARLTLTETPAPVDEPAPLGLLALSATLLVIARRRARPSSRADR